MDFSNLWFCCFFFVLFFLFFEELGGNILLSKGQAVFLGHRNSGGQSWSLPEQLFLDTILHNWLDHPAEKSYRFISWGCRYFVWRQFWCSALLRDASLFTPSVWFAIHSTFVFSRPCFFRMVHALPLRPFQPTPVSLSQPCILLLPLFSHVGITMQLFVAKTGSGIFTIVFKQQMSISALLVQWITFQWKA